MKYLKPYNESTKYKTKSVDDEFDKVKMCVFGMLSYLTLLDIVNKWDDVKNIDNPNIETIKYFVDNPPILKNECLVYDEKGLSDGYHRLIAMKILKFKEFKYVKEKNYHILESVKDFLKSKSDDKIGEELFKLSPKEILKKSIEYGYINGFKYLCDNNLVDDDTKYLIEKYKFNLHQDEPLKDYEQWLSNILDNINVKNCKYYNDIILYVYDKKVLFNYEIGRKILYCDQDQIYNKLNHNPFKLNDEKIYFLIDGMVKQYLDLEINDIYNSLFNNLTSFVTESMKHKEKYAYHVTSRKNLKSIMKNGLEPRIPEDYGENGDTKGVYLFKTLEDTENALFNWFGERIEDIEEETGEDYDEIVLKIDISGLEDELLDTVEYEWTCLVNIEPSRIVDVIEM